MTTVVSLTPWIKSAQAMTGYFQNLALELMTATHIDEKIIKNLFTFEPTVNWFDKHWILWVHSQFNSDTGLCINVHYFCFL